MKTTQNKTLLDLLKNTTDYLSGEKIAQTLGVSRNAVWKQISLLKKEGYQIIAVKNKGYLLQNKGQILDQATLSTLLNDTPLKEIKVVKQISSTNKVLKQQIDKDGYQHDALLIANSQTDGVGRYDRKFFSPSDSGVYFSLAINPKIEIALTTNITVLMAVAVVQAIEEFSKKKCDIKWVNDLLVNSKKVCGILTEGSINLETMSMNFVIVGVGINLYSPTDGFDKTIKNIAGGIFDKKENIDKNEFVAKIIKNFYNYLPNLNSPALFDEYQKRLAFVGQKVDVLKNSQKIFEGIVLGVDESFRLIVKNLADDQIVKLDSGEISTRISK